MEEGVIMEKPAWEYCDFCESPYPGCLHISGRFKECKAGPRTDAPWVVGMRIWLDLMDRRGIKNELGACEPSIQIEIIETMGRIAIKAVNGFK
jgi:hypothetical protein